MKKTLVIGFLILTQMLLIPQICHSAKTFTETFTLSVTIPAIVGLNVPAPEESTAIQSSAVSNSEVTATIQEVVRDKEKVVLKTLVVK